MSVRTTVRSGVIAALALAAIVTVSQVVKDESSKRKVIVTALWLDSPREDRVEVAISVGNSTKVTAHIVAPVTRLYKVAAGTRVQIRVRLLGKSGAKFVGCKLTVDGMHPAIGVGDSGPRSNAAPGTEVTCWGVA
jgi:hypothetical protein